MNFNRFNPLSIGGRMSEKGADRAGAIVASAVFVAATALLLFAVRWW